MLITRKIFCLKNLHDHASLLRNSPLTICTLFYPGFYGGTVKFYSLLNKDSTLHPTPCLTCLPLPHFAEAIVFNFSWDDFDSQEKLKKKAFTKFGGQIKSHVCRVMCKCRISKIIWHKVTEFRARLDSFQ